MTWDQQSTGDFGGLAAGDAAVKVAAQPNTLPTA